MLKRRKPPNAIPKPGSPYWCFDFLVAGLRYTGSTRERDKAKAQIIVEKIWSDAIADQERRERSGREPMTIAVAAARWWHEVGQHGAEADLGPYPTDNPNYANRPLAWLVNQLGSDTRLDAIREGHIADLVAKRRTSLRSVRVDGITLKRQVMPRTVNRTVTKLLRRIMMRARDTWNVELTYMPKWSKSKLLITEKRKPPRVVTFEEQAAIAAVERSELTAPREFALATALRLDEVVTLTWPQVDFTAKVFRIIQKGGHPRELPITEAIEALLRPLKGNHPTAVFTFRAQRTRRCPKTGEQFVRGQIYPMTYWGLTSLRRRAFAKAGVAANFHDLRRTAADEMSKSGVPMEAISVTLGHGKGEGDLHTTKLYLGTLVGTSDLRKSMMQRDAYAAEKRAQIAEAAEQESRKNSHNVTRITRKSQR